MSYAVSYQEPGGAAPAALSVLVHLLLFAFLYFGVQWQTKHPDSVEVELWSQLPAFEPQPAPRVETPPEPQPVVKPAPPPPQKVEAAPKKPDIAIERPKKAPKKVEPKKQEPLKFDASKRLRDQLAQEQQSLAQSKDRQDAIRQFAPPAGPPPIDAGYADKIRSRIKQYIVVPPDIKGNPETIYDVVQLPSGDVMSARLRQSSGVRAYDEAVERAILKASPLPKPDRPEQYMRDLQLKFRPQE